MSEKRCKTGGCWTKSNGDHTGFGCGCDCHQTLQVPTPDTKPGEGWGEATPRTFSELIPMHHEINGPFRGDVMARLMEENESLKQRVKVLEEALGKIVGNSRHERHGELCDMEDCFCAEEIAREALGLQCGNCGNDGEEPSKNCPTCHGTGFKALAPPVGEKKK